jgi:glucose-1-phosphate adenylyltransferase
MTNFADRNLGWRPPAYCSNDSGVRDAIVSPGCRIDGEVVSSVLSPGVRVGEGSVVRNCVLLQDVVVGKGCRVVNAIVDKDVVLEDGSQVGQGGEEPALPGEAALTVVPKGYRLPAGQQLSPGADLESIFVR